MPGTGVVGTSKTPELELEYWLKAADEVKDKVAPGMGIGAACAGMVSPSTDTGLVVVAAD